MASGLPITDPFFMQECPLCGASQRMMIRGNYVKDNKWDRYPDMGYSFCNCRNVFFTKWENISERDTTWNNCQFPLERLKKAYAEAPGDFTISMLDPYFINWNCPHEMWHWLLRKVYILWDAQSFVEECKKVGFEIVSWWRDMDVSSKTPQNFHVTLRKLETGRYLSIPGVSLSEEIIKERESYAS